MSQLAARRAFPRLHVLTDAAGGPAALERVDAALAGGAPCIQVRLKGYDDREHVAFATQVAARCQAADAWCIVNDRVDIALAAGADGVHLGAHDLPVVTARRLAGHRLAIGGTARDPATGRQLVADGADYLGVGPTYTTGTKVGLPAPLGPDAVGVVAEAVDVPVIAIAGITVENIADLLDVGVHGVAVVAAVNAAADPAAATRALLGELARVAPPL